LEEECKERANSGGQRIFRINRHSQRQEEEKRIAGMLVENNPSPIHFLGNLEFTAKESEWNDCLSACGRSSGAVSESTG
jgi:hypothetical protein